MAAQVINHFGQIETVEDEVLPLYVSLGWRYLGSVPNDQPQNHVKEVVNSSQIVRKKKEPKAS